MIYVSLNVVLEDDDKSLIIVAIGNSAKAIGMTKIAEQTGLSRPRLFKVLSEDLKSQFSTILRVLRAIGGNIQINKLPA